MGILVGMAAIWNKGRVGIFSACPPHKPIVTSCCSVRAAASCILIVGVWFNAQGDYYLGEKTTDGLN
jgi:hypothetical protein